MARSLLAFLFVSLAACGASNKAKDASPVDPPPAESSEATPTSSAPDGKEIYEQVCVTCHGATGDGTGLEQQLFSFGSSADQWKNGATEDGIIITLAQGTHDSSMQPFPQYGDAERRAVAAYVLDLRAALLASEAE